MTYKKKQETLRAGASRLPCVVHVGFAGPRFLSEADLSDARLNGALEHQLQQAIESSLAWVNTKLSPHHFICGVSQIAIGADTAFTRACGTLGLPQIIHLPQHVDAYLSAGDPHEPDFRPGEREAARALLESEHVVDVKLASRAHDRRVRFEETNRSIVAQSDLVICAIRENGSHGWGGSSHFLDYARQRGIPTVEIRFQVEEENLRYTVLHHAFENFTPPELPDILSTLQFESSERAALPTIQRFTSVVDAHTEKETSGQRARFNNAARIIIGTHVCATLLATLVLASSAAHAAETEELSHASLPLSGLLLLESLALIVGYLTHYRLHHTSISSKLSLSRLLAEINRSVQSLGRLHMPLEYLFLLRLPRQAAPLVRTLNVLHLRSTSSAQAENWQDHRQNYLRTRLTDPEKGQIQYYDKRCKTEQRKLNIARRTFQVFSLLAILATLIKLAGYLPLTSSLVGYTSITTSGLGALAILLPVMAVAVLSWTIAQDYEARVATYRSTKATLQQNAEKLATAGSKNECMDLVQATETELLGETLEWAARNTYTKVS